MASVPSNSIATSQAAIGTSATLIAPARSDRKRLVISAVTGTAAVFVGGSGVTTGTGAPLAVSIGAQLVLETNAAVYGVAAATGQTVAVIEELS